MPVVCLCVRTVHTDEAEDDEAEDGEGFRVYCIEYTVRASPLMEPQMGLYLRHF